jgi:hypothetical protein
MTQAKSAFKESGNANSLLLSFKSLIALIFYKNNQPTSDSQTEAYCPQE